MHPYFYVGGSSLNNLIELKTININPTDTNALLLNDCSEVGCPNFFLILLLYNQINCVTVISCLSHSITGTLRLQSSSAAALELTARFMDSVLLDASEQRTKTWPQSRFWHLTTKKRMTTKLLLEGIDLWHESSRSFLL